MLPNSSLNKKIMTVKSLKNGAADKALNALLEKTRFVHRAFQAKGKGEPWDYSKFSKILSDFSNSNVYFIDSAGTLLGYWWLSEYKSQTLLEGSFKDGVMPPEVVAKMNKCKNSEIHDEDAFLFDDDYSGKRPEKHLMYVPIIGVSSERLGTIMLVRFHAEFSLEDTLLAEYFGIMAAIQIINERMAATEENARARLSVQAAIRALSYSELESIKHIIAGINGLEGITIASRVADEVGVTRSVIVNAIRKLESAGLIESRSLGMKGTYIKVLSPFLSEYLGS